VTGLEPERTETTQPAQAQPEPKPEGTAGRRTLPQTASELPLVGLIGLLALGGALSARMLRKAAR